MEKRIQVRSRNASIEFLASYRLGFAFIEERHFNPQHLFIALGKDGRMYEIDPLRAEKGPALFREEPRGTCDEQPMMYVKESGIKFLYQSELRPSRPNLRQDFTKSDQTLEEQIVLEYVRWRGGEYLQPEFSKVVNGHRVKDDGGIRETGLDMPTGI